MISAFLIFCLVIGAIGFSGENDWTSVLICGGLVLFVLFCHSVSVESDKAYVNRMHYWSQSPAERERERRRVKAQVDREEREARERRLTKEERKRNNERLRLEARASIPAKKWVSDEKAEISAVRSQAESVQGDKPKCARCGYEVREVSRSFYGDAVFVLYQCPYCSEKKLKKYDAGDSCLPPKPVRDNRPERPAFRSEVMSARYDPIVRPEALRSVPGTVQSSRPTVAPVTDLRAYRTEMDDIMGTNNRRLKEETIICLNCRTYIRTNSIEVTVDGKRMREYCCPACGSRIRFSVA